MIVKLRWLRGSDNSGMIPSLILYKNRYCYSYHEWHYIYIAISPMMIIMPMKMMMIMMVMMTRDKMIMYPWLKLKYITVFLYEVHNRYSYNTLSGHVSVRKLSGDFTFSLACGNIAICTSEATGKAIYTWIYAFNNNSHIDARYENTISPF